MDQLSLRTNRLKLLQDCRKITDHSRGICSIYYPNLIEENWRMSTCNHPGGLRSNRRSTFIMPKNLSPPILIGSIRKCVRKAPLNGRVAMLEEL